MMCDRTLGHQADERDYTLSARILDDLGISSIRLITNNPTKIDALELEGIKVNKRIEVEPTVTHENVRYLQTKVERMNHMLKIKKFASVLSDGGKHEPRPTD